MSGLIVCFWCGGTGKVAVAWHLPVRCSSCDGQGIVLCHSCKQFAAVVIEDDGVLLCAACAGAGVK